MSSFVIKVPEVGESITEATVGEWLKKDGEWVEQDEPVVILETDKASVDVVAESSGLLQIKAQEGETLAVGKPLAHLIKDKSKKPPSSSSQQQRQQQPSQQQQQPSPLHPSPPSQAKTAKGNPHQNQTQSQTSQHQRETSHTPRDLSHLRPSLRSSALSGTLQESEEEQIDFPLGKSSSKHSAFTNVKKSKTVKTGHLPATLGHSMALTTKPSLWGEERSERRPMSSIRLRIAERLLQVQQSAAILSTFNEIDMTQILRLRQQYKALYEEKYGVRLGFMGFFVKAVVEALQNYPAINAFIEGNHMIYHHFYHIGVAVGTPRGLVVPVVRHADVLSLADIERTIHNFALKAKEGKLKVEDMQNGTFTVSNGGVYGSLLSTPILNPPQSGILGMHKIEQRPVVINNNVVIRPMMYAALSYDHRIVDGKEAVSFLVRVKECIEDPERLLLQV